MQTPLQVTFRHMAVSDAAEERIREHVAYLERQFGNITGCRVIVDGPPAHRTKGGAFSVHIDLAVPGKPIAATNDREHGTNQADVYIAIRDAFEAAQRQLDAHARRLRGEVKSHAAQRA